jgi:hypothetical protein
MEIETHCPGITEKVVRLALENLDEINARCRAQNALPPLQSAVHSLIFKALE